MIRKLFATAACLLLLSACTLHAPVDQRADMLRMHQANFGVWR